jgi:hypothetical protein
MGLFFLFLSVIKIKNKNIPMATANKKTEVQVSRDDCISNIKDSNENYEIKKG